MVLAFFRYMGAKAMNFKILAEYLPPQEKYRCLVDCFFGSGGFLLNHPKKTIEVVIDYDPAIAAIHICATNPILRERFKEMFSTFTMNPETYEFYKMWLVDVQNKTREDVLQEFYTDPDKMLQLATIKLYVVSSTMSGIVRENDSGGYARTRLNDNRKTRRIYPFQNEKQFDRYVQRMAGVQVYCGSYEQAEWWDSRETLFYCDPPYLDINLYKYGWQYEDWQRFEKWARKLKGFVMISSQHHDEIIDLFSYKKWRIFDVEFHYSSVKKSGEELVITNYPVRREWTDSLDFYLLGLDKKLK